MRLPKLVQIIGLVLALLLIFTPTAYADSKEYFVYIDAPVDSPPLGGRVFIGPGPGNNDITPPPPEDACGVLFDSPDGYLWATGLAGGGPFESPSPTPSSILVLMPFEGCPDVPAKIFFNSEPKDWLPGATAIIVQTDDDNFAFTDKFGNPFTRPPGGLCPGPNCPFGNFGLTSGIRRTHVQIGLIDNLVVSINAHLLEAQLFPSLEMYRASAIELKKAQDIVSEIDVYTNKISELNRQVLTDLKESELSSLKKKIILYRQSNINESIKAANNSLQRCDLSIDLAQQNITDNNFSIIGANQEVSQALRYCQKTTAFLSSAERQVSNLRKLTE